MINNILDRLKKISDVQEADYWKAVRDICGKDPSDKELVALLDLGKVFGFMERTVREHIQAYETATNLLSDADRWAQLAMNRPAEIENARNALPDAQKVVADLKQRLAKAEENLKALFNVARGNINDYVSDYNAVIASVTTLRDKYPLLLDKKPKQYQFPVSPMPKAPVILMS